MPDSPAPHEERPSAAIRVRGARTHNLKGIDVDIPRDRLVVITGVSGSGKSSLAFDTLFAEGQRRYLETLSASTRQFLDQMQRPDVDDIEGLPPTLAVEQRPGSIQPRSTLATTTQIHDFLRLLYARAGRLHCWQCGQPVARQSPQAIVDGILALEAGRKVMIQAPLVRGRKGKHRELFERINREGFVRARVDGTIVDAAAPPELNKAKPHDIDVIIDRIVVKEGLRARLHESVALALRHGEGTCLISHLDGETWHDRLLSSKFACARCGISFPEIEPRTFSFNTPYGACQTCKGLGTPGTNDRLQEGHAKHRKQESAGQEEEGSEGEAPAVCPDCHGARLGPVARSVRIAGRGIHEFAALTVEEAEQAAAEMLPAIEVHAARQAAERIVPEIVRRLGCLGRLGVGYLALDRSIRSLSGGEYQRARLAGCLGSGLRGVCYLLDEPTLGLHPRDSQRLFETLCELRDQGNSVVIVEHDLDIIRQADGVIDLGPGAGNEGGCVIAQGTPGEVRADSRSITGRYLRESGAFLKTSPTPRIADCQAVEAAAASLPPGEAAPHAWLSLSGARTRNLRNVAVRFPLGALTCVTGVSGSGKSALVMETLVPLVCRTLNARARAPAGDERALDSPPRVLASPASETQETEPRIAGLEFIDRLIEIDQSPLGRNARSNPATASGLWDEIRRVFARTREARMHGFRAARFSFNSAAGRCEHCRGLGTRRIGMHFLPEIDVVCPACGGARFNRQTLEVRFHGKSVADVLEMRVDEAVDFFANFAGLSKTLATFVEVGLGYLTLGQSAVTLSGGEAQRIRLATELSRAAPGRTLYVLDEPTTGLHAADIERLWHLLTKLVAEGQTVIVIEHQLEVIRSADHVIDLGPEGGSAGGRIVVCGSPAAVAGNAGSHTGQALRARFGAFAGEAT
jgi:excinuclease ABC subunit A